MKEQVAAAFQDASTLRRLRFQERASSIERDRVVRLWETNKGLWLDETATDVYVRNRSRSDAIKDLVRRLQEASSCDEKTAYEVVTSEPEVVEDLLDCD